MLFIIRIEWQANDFGMENVDRHVFCFVLYTMVESEIWVEVGEVYKLRGLTEPRWITEYTTSEMHMMGVKPEAYTLVYIHLLLWYGC